MSRTRDKIARLKKEAATFRTKGRYRKSASTYRQLTELDPVNPTWPHKLGQVLQKLGQDAEAMNALEKAARNYVKKGFVLKAIAMCKMILNQDPDNTRVQETLLQLHEQNPKPRRTEKLRRQEPPKAPSTPALEMAPAEPAGPAMVPMHQVVLDQTQLEQPPDTAPISPVDTGQILSAEPADGDLIQLLPEDDEDDAPRLPEPTPAATKPAGPGPDEAGKKPRRERSSETLENIPLTVALPDAREAATTTTGDPVWEIPLEEEWVDIDMDDTDPAGGDLVDRLPPVPLLSSLSADELRSFIDKVSVEQYQEGETIIEQGAWGDTLYILVQGTVGVLCQTLERMLTLGMLNEGAFFGEYALLTNLRHTVSVEAMDDCTVLAVSRRVMRALLEEHPPVLKVLLSFFRRRLIQNLTTNHPLFKSFAGGERSGLVEKFHFLEAPANRVLVREGQRPDGLYLLVCGDATVHRTDAPSADLRMGEMFCKTALLSRAVSSNTVRTASKCWMLWLPREAFNELIMTHPQVLATITEAGPTGRYSVGKLGLDDHEETLTVF